MRAAKFAMMVNIKRRTDKIRAKRAENKDETIKSCVYSRNPKRAKICYFNVSNCQNHMAEKKTYLTN